MRLVGFWANALMLQLVVGTMAMFEVMAPSTAFRVETTGCVSQRWDTAPPESLAIPDTM